MADLQKTVQIIFEGVDRMGSGVDSVSRQVGDVSRSLQGVTEPVANFTKDMLKLQAGLAATGVAVTGLALKLSGDFDSQFREIATLIDAPVESLGQFKDQILEYASSSTQSFGEVNSAIYSAISAGVDYEDSLTAVAQAEQLAIAGKADLGETLTVLVSSLNAYGLGMEDAERFSDLLFQTVRSGQTTLPELGNSLASVTGLAATAGIEFDELLSAVAALTATGTGTSEAMTQIRAAISNIIKPTEQASQLADQLGVDFSAAALESQGLAGVLQSVGEATGGNAEQMAQLFGSVQALNGVLTLTGNGAEKFNETLGEMQDAAGATEAAYEKMVDSLGGERIQSAIQGLLLAIGTPLIDEFGGIQDAIAEIFKGITDSVRDGALTGFIDELNSMMAGAEETLKQVAANLPAALEQADFSAFFNGIEAIRDAIGGLFDNADLTTVDGLVTVIETLGLGFETLSVYTAGAIEALVPFIEQVAALANWVLQIDPAIIAWAGTLGGLAIALNSVLGIISSLSGGMAALAGSGGAIAGVTKASTALITVLSGPAGLAVALGLGAAAAVSLGRDLLGLGEKTEYLGTPLEDLAHEFEYLGEQALETTRDLSRALDEGSVVWSDTAGAFIDASEAIGHSIAGIDIGDFAEKVKQDLAEVEKDVERTGRAWVENFSLMIEAARGSSEAGDQLRQLGEDIQQAFDEGRINSDQFDLLQGRLEGTADSARELGYAAGEMTDGWQAGEFVFDEAAGALVRLEDSLKATGSASSEFARDFQEVLAALGESGDVSGEFESAYRELQTALADGLIDEQEFLSLRDGLHDAANAARDASPAIVEVADAALTSEDAILKARQAVLEMELSMEQLASNERIRNMELTVDLRVADMENQTKRMQSAFQSVDNTITSTGETLASLFDTYASAPWLDQHGRADFGMQWEMENQLREENNRRNEAMEMQRDLIDAQIRQLEERTRQMQNGDGLIKIDSSGLEPALESIMWQIIEKVQMRANAEASEFLLGI